MQGRQVSFGQRIVKRLKQSWQWYLLLLPAIIYVAIFQYGPMYGLQIAFKRLSPALGDYGKRMGWL